MCPTKIVLQSHAKRVPTGGECEKSGSSDRSETAASRLAHAYTCTHTHTHMDMFVHVRVAVRACCYWESETQPDGG